MSKHRFKHRLVLKNMLENCLKEFQARDGGRGREHQKVVVKKRGWGFVIKDWPQKQSFFTKATENKKGGDKG